MGVGEDFNESLLETMAEAGDGNYWYIETPDQLPGILESELKGFLACIGRETRLSAIAPAGVELDVVLNDLPHAPDGQLILPTLVAGRSLDLGIRLRVDGLEPKAGKAPIELCTLLLSWKDSKSGERHKLSASLSMPVSADAGLLPADESVRETLGLLRSARIKREAMAAIDSGDAAKVRSLLAEARLILEALPQSREVGRELASLASLGRELEDRSYASLKKSAHYEAHARAHGSDAGILDVYYLRKFAAMVGHRISVVMGDILAQEVDAIVNSWEPLASGAAGLDKTIQDAGGPRLRAACAKLEPCQPGQARATGGYDLIARHVFHAVAPAWHGGQGLESALLANAWGSCFALALEFGIRSIAFPALGCGGWGFPPETAASVAASVVLPGLMRLQDLERAIVVCRDRPTYEAFTSALNARPR
jgi:Ca-activated chloride channel family protein